MTTKCQILEYIADVEYDYHVLPHYGMIPDYIVCYKELSALVRDYFAAQEEAEEELE